MILLIVYILSLLPCWYSLVKSFELSFIHHLNKAFFSYFRDILCVNEKVFKALWWWKRYASTTDITWQHLLTIKGIFISIRYDSSFNNTMIFNIHFLVCMFSNCLHKMHNHVHHHSRKEYHMPCKAVMELENAFINFSVSLTSVWRSAHPVARCYSSQLWPLQARSERPSDAS